MLFITNECKCLVGACFYEESSVKPVNFVNQIQGFTFINKCMVRITMLVFRKLNIFSFC